MTVLDASVLVSALVATDDHGEWADSVWEAGPTAAPEIAFVETTNVLRRLEARGEVTEALAEGGLRELLRSSVKRYAFAPYAERVWDLRHRLTAYDACYVALAESFECRLATLDRKLARTAGDYCEVICPVPPGAAGD